MYYNHELFNLYYKKLGGGKQNIVILPGWGNNRETFNYLIDTLKEYFTIYIFDYPGFGKTKFPNKDLTIYDYATVINDFLDDKNINKPIIMGHSFGGRLIILLASIHKKHFSKIMSMCGEWYVLNRIHRLETLP